MSQKRSQVAAAAVPAALAADTKDNSYLKGIDLTSDLPGMARQPVASMSQEHSYVKPINFKYLDDSNEARAGNTNELTSFDWGNTGDTGVTASQDQEEDKEEKKQALAQYIQRVNREA